jgi:DNA-binding transcriptional LysR family regulator
MGAREDEVTHLRELAKIARRDGRRTKKTVAGEYLLKLATRLEKEAAELEEQQPQGQSGSVRDRPRTP